MAPAARRFQSAVDATSARRRSGGGPRQKSLPTIGTNAPSRTALSAASVERKRTS